MTTHPPQTGTWLTAHEIAAQTGLRLDLVTRFVPHVDSPSGPLYNAQHLAVARHVKQLVDANVCAESIDAAVRDISNSEGVAAFNHGQSTGPRRGKILAAAGAAATVALIIGGVIGGLIGYNNRGTAPTAAPVTITAEAVPPEPPAVPSKPDPVCAEWGPMATDYTSKQVEWSKGDPAVPASRWSSEERAENMAIIPVLRAQADDMRKLADRAQDPVLRSLLQSQAAFEDAYADRLPVYEPGDQRLWQAAINFSSAVKSQCTAMAPR